MCDPTMPGRPGTPEYRAEWLERRHEQMKRRIAEMNHAENVATARADRFERALRHITSRPDYPEEIVAVARNAIADACRHLGELTTEDGETFACVDCGHTERSFSLEEIRERLGVDHPVEDGFGGQWGRCGPDCDLNVVRPGKVQCDATDPACPNRPEGTT